jgi:TolB protein
VTAEEVKEARADLPPGRQPRLLAFRLFLILAIFAVGGLAWAGLKFTAGLATPTGNPTLWALATALGFTSTPSATQPAPSPSLSATPAPTRSAVLGTLGYASRLAGRTHLWAYVTGESQPVPLTAGEWEDRDPAFSPDGQWLAFSSHRDGNWDLYLLNLRSGGITRVTDTPGYEGRPTWSPDGQWLAYEAYLEGDLDIWILSLDQTQPPIQLTNQDGVDISPTWDPNGRRIAFVSDRDGTPDVFLADLENPSQRFTNLTNTPYEMESDPAFSPDGTRLAYTSTSEGIQRLLVLDLGDPGLPPVEVGQGARATWSPDGLTLAAVLSATQGPHLLLYPLSGAGLQPLGFPLAGQIYSLSWTGHGLPEEAIANGQELPIAEPLYMPNLATASSGPGRVTVVRLTDVEAPNPSLSDAVDEAFDALRSRAAEELGWDFLAGLEHAFVGLNDPLPPGFAYNDWLYTGRAFAFNQSVYQAQWVEVVREDYGAETYWRVFVRTSPQDGSAGVPLRVAPWEFGARFSGDPALYDQGGAPAQDMPVGYYIDFTALAADYGFERLPSLPNWRTFYPAARFNEFAMTEGMEWTTAMLEIYPAEAIITPTPYRTVTPTPTRTLRPTPTPWWLRWRTPTVTRTPTSTPLPTTTPTP